MNRHPQVDTLELVNTELASRLDRQSASLAGMDTKATLVVGYALAAASFLATRPAQIVLAVLAYVAFAMASGFGISSIAVRNYQDIEPRYLFTESLFSGKSEALAAVAAARVKHFEFNRGRLDNKVRQWWRSLFALFAGTLLMLAAIMVQTYQHDHSKEPAGSVSVSPRGKPGGTSPADSRASTSSARGPG